MAKYVSVGLKTKGYAPREGKAEFKLKRMAVPTMSQDEPGLRLGVPDGLKTGSPLAGIPHNPGYHGRKKRGKR